MVWWQVFRLLDVDGDGNLSEEEYAEFNCRCKAKGKSMCLACQVVIALMMLCVSQLIGVVCLMQLAEWSFLHQGCMRTI